MYARSRLVGPPPQMIVTEMLDATPAGGTGALTVVGYTTAGPSGITLTGNDAGGVAYQRGSSAYLAKTTGFSSLVYDLSLPAVVDCALFVGWLGVAGNTSVRIHDPGGGYVFSHYVDVVDHDFSVVLPVAAHVYRIHHDIIPGVGSRMRIEDMTAGGREVAADHALTPDTYQFNVGISSGAAAAARSANLYVRHYSSDL